MLSVFQELIFFSFCQCFNEIYYNIYSVHWNLSFVYYLGGQGVPVTDPAMTDIVAGCQGLTFSLTSFLMGLVISYLLI